MYSIRPRISTSIRAARPPHNICPIPLVRTYARQPSEFFTSHQQRSAQASSNHLKSEKDIERLLIRNPLEEHEEGDDGVQGQHETGTGTGTGGPEKDEDLSDREWDIQVGHAIHHLRTTLPTFFETGLIVHPVPFVDPPSSPPSPSSPTGTGTGKSVYSPYIRLSYTPPFPLPSPFPRTLHIEGLALYTASARVVRATMAAFHTDLNVSLRRMYVATHGRRERAARILLNVSGFGRVTGQRSEWDVNCTYTFSPTSGLINHHRIESIDPAPHISVYEGFKNSLMRVLRGGEGPEPKRALESTRTCNKGRGASE